MTADMSWLASFPGRCPTCYLHESQGHRSHHDDGTLTGCTPSGELGLMLARQAEGVARKHKAFSDLDKSDTTDELSVIRREIIALGRRKRDFTPDDLPAELRAQTNPNRRGRAFSSLLDDNVIYEVDRVKSANPRAHGKKVGVYRLVAA